MVKAYVLQVDEQYHGLCQSTAAGANSTDKFINQRLIEQVEKDTEIRSLTPGKDQKITHWKNFQLSSSYVQDIESYIGKIIPEDFYVDSFFDISHSEGRLSHYLNKIRSIFRKDKISFQKQRWLYHTIDVFGWYFQFNLPGKKILSLGCGSGYELFFLRHQYPDAEIVAVDWVNKVPKEFLEKLDIPFIEANVYDFLSSHQGEYDLIYSSHVLEHSYQIDHLLMLLNNALMPGGILASSLPLCGFEETQYASFLEKVLGGQSKLRQLDCNMLDLGHPWKTNQYDLYNSLVTAQFQNIQILGNENSCVRGIHISLSQWKKQANFMFLLHSIFFSPMKKFIYLFVSDPLPYGVVNFNCNLDWKFSFGGGRIANFVPEVFFIAHKSRG
jgi:2-polyprenyl-3-methyl-5-hydroxy-6-metoxy-1,4-benzoquinol methylase